MLSVLEVCTDSAPAYALVFKRAQLINNRHRHLIQADILCNDGKEVRQMRDQGMHVEVTTIHRSLNPLRLIQSTYNLFRVIHKHPYDVIHLHFGVPSLIGRLLAIFLRQPIWIYQSHGYSLSANTGKLGRFSYLATERLLKHTVRYALFQSYEDIETARRYRLLKEKQIIYLGNGIDIERFSPSLNTATSTPERKIVFSMVARFEPVKNYQLFIDAIKHLRLKTDNFKAYMIGEGYQKEMIAAQIAAHELYDLVEIIPYRQDMPTFYRHIDVGVLTSLGEGLPRALLEPMACGKPVLCTDVKGSREAVIDGKTGYILPLAEPEKLAEKMLWCINHQDALPKMGVAAREHVVRNHDEQQVIKRLSDLYLRCYQALYQEDKLRAQI